MRNTLERQLMEGCTGIYGDDAVSGMDLLGRIDRVIGAEVVQLGDVVDAVAVQVSGFGDLVLLHSILVCGQGFQIVGQRGSAVLTPRHRNRDIGGCPIESVLRIQHEIIVGCRSHFDRNIGHGDRCWGGGHVAGFAGSGWVARCCRLRKQGGGGQRHEQDPQERDSARKKRDNCCPSACQTSVRSVSGPPLHRILPFAVCVLVACPLYILPVPGTASR